MNIISFLLSTNHGAFLAGANLAVGFTASTLSLGFYFVFKKKLLLYFALLMLLTNIVVAFLNQDPRVILDVHGHPVYLRMFHLISAFGTFFFYKLVVESAGAGGNLRTIRILSFFTVVTLVFRALVILNPVESLILLSSVTAILFCAASFAVNLSLHPVSTVGRISKICFLIFPTVLIFSLVRLGVLPTDPLQSYLPYILSFITIIVSTVWLFAIIGITWEINEETRLSEMETRARAFVQLRDLMNTPLQILELSLATMSEETKEELLTAMRNAVAKLTQISRLLTRHESEIDWEKREKFFDEKEL